MGRLVSSTNFHCQPLFQRWSKRSEGSLPSGAGVIAPQPCIRSVHEDRNHDAVMRIGGEAPGWRAQSRNRYQRHGLLRVTATSDRHRQFIARGGTSAETACDCYLLNVSPAIAPGAGPYPAVYRQWLRTAIAR